MVCCVLYQHKTNVGSLVFFFKLCMLFAREWESEGVRAILFGDNCNVRATIDGPHKAHDALNNNWNLNSLADFCTVDLFNVTNYGFSYSNNSPAQIPYENDTRNRNVAEHIFILLVWELPVCVDGCEMRDGHRPLHIVENKSQCTPHTNEWLVRALHCILRRLLQHTKCLTFIRTL